MRKFLTTTLAALTVVSGIAVTATPAQAQADGYDYGRDYRRDRHRSSDRAAIAAVAAIAGLAIGAAISSRNTGARSNRGYDYSDGRYGNGYDYDARDDSYSGGYGSYSGYGGYGGYGGYSDRSYDRPYGQARTCVTREKTYDPYTGRRVTIERRYAC